MSKLRLPALALAIAAFAALPGPVVADDDDDRERVDIDVLSGGADQVSGGDALVKVEASRADLDDLRVLLDGADITDAFEQKDGDLVGLVTGLQLGRNRLEVLEERRGRDKTLDRLTLENHPQTGPIFSGPHQVPFVCKTIQAGLGEPLVDNQAGQGFAVRGPDPDTGQTVTIGHSRNCSIQSRVDYQYRTTGGAFAALPADGSRPANMAQTTLLDGRTVDYVVRRERGTINRFIYSFAMLAPLAEAQAPQGEPGGSALYDIGLRQGYAIVHSSGTRTSTHYNLELGGETALMTKEEFVERYGPPLYTVGVGGSGGAIQQYVYGQNHPGLLDAGIPQYSYPDMVTQTIHVGDCELLEHYMDVTDASNPKWQNWDDREWLEGLNAHPTLPNPYRGGAPGNTECVNGWRGLTPLAMNPLFGSAGAGTQRINPAVMAAVHWTHWEDVKNVYGVGP